MATKSIQAFPQVHKTPTLEKGQADPQFAAVQRFLERFGYLPSAGAGAGPTVATGQLDDPTSEALALYQRRHALPVTGVFDEATRAQMSKHRCGMPDLDNGVAFVTRCAWPTPQLTFAFEDGTADTGGEFNAVRAAVRDAGPRRCRSASPRSRATQSPDVAIDWRPAADPDHSMIGGILAHADFPPACGVITNTLPKPVHFDDSEHAWRDRRGARRLRRRDGRPPRARAHPRPAALGRPRLGDVRRRSTTTSTNRVLTADDLLGIRQLYPTAVLANGTYTVRQKSSGRFLDAHEIEPKDFHLVTRPAQNNDTQRWTLTQVGTVFVIRQKSSGRFLDAHEASDNDFRLVTRPGREQRDAALGLDARRRRQRHAAAVEQPPLHGRARDRVEGLRAGDAAGAGQRHAAVDADAGRRQHLHDPAAEQRPLHGRPRDRLEGLLGGHPRRPRTTTPSAGCSSRSAAVYTVTQKSNGRFVDAHEHSGLDFGVVTRPNQNNDTQRWVRAAERGRQLHRPAVERRPVRRRARLGGERLPGRHARRREQRHAALVLRSRLSR